MKKFIFTLFTALALTLMFSLTTFAFDYMGGKVVTEGGRLNLRKAPSQSSEILGSLKNGSIVTLKDKKGNWYFAEYSSGKTAYLNEAYVKTYPKTIDATVKLSSGRLNVRQGAGTSYPIVDSLKNGDRVVVIKSDGKWCRILYKGNNIGYVARPYLVRTSEVSSPSSVKLSVPSFKQTDSRWANYPLGATGGTIGTIGCTTTALAMVESYHTKTTVTPPDMAKKLSYSSSGSLYWPSTHNVSVAGSDYLSVIYNLLKQGKPVVLGAKKSNGSQHWVVVYGYDGNGIKPSSFLINDPGSNSRTRLSHFLEAYPTPYKICYKK